MDAIFAAADITGLVTNVSTLLIAFVGVCLLFVGYRHLLKVLLSAVDSGADPPPYMSFLEWRRQKRRERAYAKYQMDSDLPGVSEVGFFRTHGD